MDPAALDEPLTLLVGLRLNFNAAQHGQRLAPAILRLVKELAHHDVQGMTLAATLWKLPTIPKNEKPRAHG